MSHAADPSIHQIVLDAMQQGVLAADSEGRIRFLNPRAERLLQCRLADTAGKPLTEFVTFAGPAALGDGWIGGKDRRGMSQPESGEALLVNGRGAEIPVRYSAAPAPDPGGLIVITISDHTGDIRRGTVCPASAPRGLLERQAAVEKIRQTVSEGGAGWYAVLFQVERMAFYGQRYGTEAALHIKQCYAHHLDDGLKCRNFFDWSGDGFLLLMHSETGEKALRDRIRMVTGRRIDIAVKDTSAILSVTARWEIVSLANGESADALVARLEYGSGPP